MTDPRSLIEQLRKAGIRLAREDDDLMLSTDASSIAPELVEQVRVMKPALMAHLAMTTNGAAIAPQRALWPGPTHCPASALQRRLWIIDQSTSDRASYNMSHALRVCGPLDLVRLEQAVNAVIANHEILRTEFTETGGELLQVIRSSVHVPITRIQAEPGADAAAAEAAMLHQCASACFDLRQAPLLRVQALRTAEHEHVVCFTVHHIIFDAWSSALFQADLLRAYAGAADARSQVQPGTPLQFADYAFWKHQARDVALERRQLEFWSKALCGAPAISTIPYDYPTAEHPNSDGAAVLLDFDAEQSAAVHRFIASRRTTLFVLTTAVLSALLSRYSGQDDICIGVPVSTRSRAEMQSLIGFLVNTVVMRTAVSASMAFDKLLEQCGETSRTAQSNVDIPFDEVVEHLRPERNLTHSPLFQVMLCVHQAPAANKLGNDLEIVPVALARGSSKYDLVLNIQEQGGQLSCLLEYRTQLFAHLSAKRFLDNFQTLLLDAIIRPACPLHELRHISKAELDLQLVQWNATTRPLPDEPIHHQFQLRCRETPHATALVSDAQSVSFSELNARANRLAAEFSERGVGPGDRVMLCMARSVSFIANLLAAVKIGAIFVPVDPLEPEARLAHMHGELQPRLVIFDEHATDAATKLAQAISHLSLQTASARRPDLDPPMGGTTSDSAYVMFTSGSTGTPKGAAVAHAGLVNRFRWQIRTHGYVASDVFVQKSPMTFDTSIWEIFIPLSLGARLVVAPHDAHRDPQLLAQLIADNAITVIDFVPSMLAVFLAHCGPHGELIRSLRHVILGGEPLPLHLLRELARLSPARVYNQYGPTETSIGVTAWIGTPGDVQVSIGRPIDNTRIYVLDPTLAPLPIGAGGELFIGGTPVGNGYFGRTELTEKVFLPNPFVPGDTLYRTGDLARFMPDGNIDYRGRLDSQIKIRGMRVELGEISRAVLDHPRVREAHAIITTALGAPELALYYIAAGLVTITELRLHLVRRLPRHMLPVHYVAMQAFPLTVNGKVDTKRLPAPVRLAPAGKRPLEDQGQSALARVWHSLLDVAPTDPDDDFFELGGHSLLATQLVSAIRSQLFADLSVRDVFEYPTIALMSERIGHKRSGLEVFEI